MIEVKIKDAQRDLPSLAEKALGGEDVVITVGKNRLRLTPAESNGKLDAKGSRPGRGAWKGRVTIPDSFYEPWSAEEIGERDA